LARSSPGKNESTPGKKLMMAIISISESFNRIFPQGAKKRQKRRKGCTLHCLVTREKEVNVLNFYFAPAPRCCSLFLPVCLPF
jgi:hypothetical protein